MKGIVFTSLNDMIEEEFGLAMWEQVLDEVSPVSGGVYTSVEDYADSELFSLVTALSKLLDKPVDELVQHFGYYLFGRLAEKYRVFVDTVPDLFSFLESIDGVIHKEVEKLYVNPNLPSIQTKRESEGVMELVYQSPRKLCHLAAGLIKGAASHYETPLEISHGVCMHDGEAHCEFMLRCV